MSDWGLIAFGDLFLFCTGWYLHMMINSRKKKSAPVPPPPPEPKGETYGHPLPPVKTLYDALPSPPAGCAWEIEVVPTTLTRILDDQQHTREMVPSLKLELRLLDLVAVAEGAGTVISKMASNLFWQCWYEFAQIADGGGKAWSTYYRNYPRTQRNQEMRDEFIYPYLSWARIQVDLRIATAVNSNNPGEYRMKT